MKLGVKEMIELCIYCWGRPLLYTFSGSVADWMLLSGNIQHERPRLVGQEDCVLVGRPSTLRKPFLGPKPAPPLAEMRRVSILLN